jgi:SpoVK/Ycf46/Vps4 family AAA+-type ATPase
MGAAGNGGAARALVMLFFSIARAIGRASRRRRRREQELALRRARERGEDGDVASPFAGMPFGSLFEQMLGGAWTTVGVRLDELARDAEGMSPAGLKAMCQEAGLAAMTRDAPSVGHEDFTEALDRLRRGATARASYV